MAKPLTEHSTKLRAGKGDKAPLASSSQPARSRVLEPVEGGRVRRIVFEGDEPVPAPTPVRSAQRRAADEWMPRHRADMDDIEFEVDHLDRIKPRRKASVDPKSRIETGTLYETERGGVHEARQMTSRGERRVLYTSKRDGDRIEERRFSGRMVDEILAKRDAPVEEEVVREESVEYVSRKRRVVEEVVVEPKKAKKPKVEKATKKTSPKVAKEAKAVKPAKKVAPVVAPVEESEYQPQCAAVTKGGVQCRNSAKDGSRHCGSHQGYKPVSARDLADTAPVHAGAADTLPGQGREKTAGGKQAQCGAYTSSGMQCRNSSRKNSKYCGAHKGYRAPSKAQLESRLDTKPRWDKAPDTLPDVK